MYVNNKELTALFVAYQHDKASAEHWQARCERLLGNAKERRRDRFRRGFSCRDNALHQARKELAAVSRQLSARKAAIAAAAYLVAERYWPKFSGPTVQYSDAPTLHSSVDSDDAIQQAVLRVVEVAHRFDASRGSAFNWLTKVVQNEFRGLVRKQLQGMVNFTRYADVRGQVTGGSSQESEDQVDEVQIVLTQPVSNLRPLTSARAKLLGASCEYRNHQYVIGYYLGQLRRQTKKTLQIRNCKLKTAN